MARVNLKKPDFYERFSAEALTEYLNGLVDELEYLLGNLDEKNLTPAFREKLEKIKKEGEARG